MSATMTIERGVLEKEMSYNLVWLLFKILNQGTSWSWFHLGRKKVGKNEGFFRGNYALSRRSLQKARGPRSASSPA